MELRNKLIAHQDAEYFDRLLSVVAAEPPHVDESKKAYFPLEIVYVGLFLSSISDKSILERMTNHIKSSADAVHAVFLACCEEYRHCISENKSNFETSSKDRRNEVAHEVATSVVGEVRLHELNYSINMNTPEIRSRNGFSYQHLEAKHRKLGKVTAISPDGTVQELDIFDLEQRSPERDEGHLTP